MNKFLSRILLTAIAAFLLLGLANAGAASLPSGLTAIEDEAFMGNTSLSGVMALPSGVSAIGTDAFSGTSLYALDVPAGVVSMGSQRFNNAAYVHVRGAATSIGSLSGVQYIIAPAGSPAQAQASASGVDFVAESALVEANGFYFCAQRDGLILLSARNGGSISGSVTIPSSVGTQKVIGASDYAFMGCRSVTSLQLPEALQDSMPAGALAGCPNASVSYYADPVYVKAVTTDVTAGANGNSITWRVEAKAESGIRNYLYTVERNGVEVLSKESSSATFTYEAQDAGEYQLLVIVRDHSGNYAAGKSDMLYIAVEAMQMSLPETQPAGSDLVIAVEAVEGAQYYSVFLTNEATGQAVGSIRSLSKPGNITVSGYDLEPGTYRVTGYVIGNDFRYTVPTVKHVTMTGSKAEGPVIPAQQPLVVNMGSRAIMLSETDSYAIRYQYAFSDGTTSSWYTSKRNGGENSYISAHTSNGDWSKGGTILVQGALVRNGKWTAWGPITEVPVLGAPQLATPTFTAPAAVSAGEDVPLQIAKVENAEHYEFSLFAGYYPNQVPHEGEPLWNDGRHFQDLRSVTIPGYMLDAGVYTIQTAVFRDGYESAYYQHRLDVSGVRPAAPTVTADKTEVYHGQSVRLDLYAPGAEGAAILRTASNGVSEANWWSTYTTALDENGRGYRSISLDDSALDGYTHSFRVCVIVNGQWSEFATVSCLQKAREPIAPVVITAPATIEAGCELELTFEGVEHAENYRVYYERVYDDTRYHLASGLDLPGKVLTIPGYNLMAGTYRILVEAESAEYGESESVVTFTVTGSRPLAPSAAVDKTTVATRENFTFTIDSTGGEMLRSRVNEGSYTTSHDNINVIEDATIWATSHYSVGEYNYSFSLFKDGKWSAWSEPIHISVSDHALAAPTLSLPSSLSAGRDLTVNVGTVSNAEYYNVSLYNRAGNRLASIRLNSSEAGAVTFDGYFFSAGTYTIEATAYNSYGSNTAEKTISVRSVTRPTAPAATADTDLGRLNVGYGFTIPTSGVEKAAVRYYRADNTNNVTYKTLTATGDSTRWSDSKNTADQVWNYAFAVQKNGMWSPWSSTLQVTITNREQLAQTVITIPETIEAGQDVKLSFSAVANADSYTVRLYKPDGSYTSYYSNKPNTDRLLNGYDLLPGTYRVMVEASGAEYDSSTTEKAFTVTGVRPAAPAVSVDKKNVFTNDTYTFMIENGDSELIAYRYTSNSGSSSSGTLNAPTDVTAWDVSSSSGNTYNYSFCTLKDGKWSAWSTAISVTVNKRPELPVPVLTLPDAIPAGQNLNVTFTEVTGASYYYVYLYDLRGQQITSRYVKTAGSTEFYGYLLPANYVRVEVVAYGDNGGSSKADKTLKVTNTALPAAPTAVTSAGSSVAAGDYFTFTISAPGADLIAVRYYRIGSPNSVYYTTFKPDASWRTYRSDSGTTWAYAFAAQVDGVWSAWSPYTEINIE